MSDKLEAVYKAIQQLPPAERERLRQWLNGNSRTTPPASAEALEEEDVPKETREEREADLRCNLEKLERIYGIPSDEFVRRYDAREVEVMALDDAGLWRELYRWWEQVRDDQAAQQT